MGKLRSTGQAPSSPAFKIGPEGYVFYIVLHLDVACPKFYISKNLSLEAILKLETMYIDWEMDSSGWQRAQIYCAVKVWFFIQYTQ